MRKRQPLFFMKRALSLAAKGAGRVSPNPLVGCVIVKKGRIIAEGFHSFYGGPHAEIAALKKAGTRAKGSDLYLTLEPCAHFGKTPPCAPAIVQAGIKTAFIAMRDPNPLVHGKGIALLRQSRIRVHEGLNRKEAERLNPAFIKWMKTGRPYIRLKSAVSLDGKTATAKNRSKWVTSPESRGIGHRLRSESDAVVIGASTAIKDNPLLTSHHRGRNPIRVVLDPRLRTAAPLKLYQDRSALTVVFTSSRASKRKIRALRKKGVLVLTSAVTNGVFDLRRILNSLSKLNVSQILVEGGGETAWHFVKEKLVDEVVFFVAPILLGGRTAPTAVGGVGFPTLAGGLKLHQFYAKRSGPDIVIRGRV